MLEQSLIRNWQAPFGFALLTPVHVTNCIVLPTGLLEYTIDAFINHCTQGTAPESKMMLQT